jgi:hypothetical protein
MPKTALHHASANGFLPGVVKLLRALCHLLRANVNNIVQIPVALVDNALPESGSLIELTVRR